MVDDGDQSRLERISIVSAEAKQHRSRVKRTAADEARRCARGLCLRLLAAMTLQTARSGIRVTQQVQLTLRYENAKSNGVFVNPHTEGEKKHGQSVNNNTSIDRTNLIKTEFAHDIGQRKRLIRHF